MIHIIAVGKTKQLFVKDGVVEFLKRCGRYAKIEFVEVKSLGELKGYIITLDEHGKQYDSHSFAQKLSQWTMLHKEITFVIGPAEGLSSEILNKAQEKISLSLMTFPTQLARLIFVEQLYRAFTILNHEPYHRE